MMLFKRLESIRKNVYRGNESYIKKKKDDNVNIREGKDVWKYM